MRDRRYTETAYRAEDLRIYPDDHYNGIVLELLQELYHEVFLLKHPDNECNERKIKEIQHKVNKLLVCIEAMLNQHRRYYQDTDRERLDMIVLKDLADRLTKLDHAIIEEYGDHRA